ncbi:hypothetical protein C5S42_00645 [Candidatus Methanomarinus sp.]|nr:hypothetical protein C5S42_00645 [ANME-2 cluster archaeon]
MTSNGKITMKPIAGVMTLSKMTQDRLSARPTRTGKETLDKGVDFELTNQYVGTQQIQDVDPDLAPDEVRLEPSTQIDGTIAGSFGKTLTYTIDGNMDYCSSLKVRGINTLINTGTAQKCNPYTMLKRIKIYAGNSAIINEITNQETLLMYVLTHSSYKEYTALKIRGLDNEIDRGTGTTPLAAPWILDLAPLIPTGNRLWIVSNKLITQKIKIDLVFATQATCVDGNATDGGAPSEVYILQKGYNSITGQYIAATKVEMRNGVNHSFPCNYFEETTVDVAAAATTASSIMDWCPRTQIEEILIASLGTASATSKAYNFLDDIESIDTMKMDLHNKPYYPNSSEYETSAENLYDERIEHGAYPNIENVYRICLQDTSLSDVSDSEKKGLLKNFGSIDNSLTPYAKLYFTGVTAASKIIIVAISRQYVTIMANGTLGIIRS